jgi:arginyl-tRNA synthetase
MLAITKFGPAMEQALQNLAPNQICAYIYELAGCVNKFYHETPILKEENEELKAGYIALMGLTKEILEACINILGFSAPDKM